MLKTLAAIAALAFCFAPTSSGQIAMSGLGLLGSLGPVSGSITAGDYWGTCTITGCDVYGVVYDMSYKKKDGTDLIEITEVDGIFSVPQSPGGTLNLGAIAVCNHDGSPHGFAIASTTFAML